MPRTLALTVACGLLLGHAGRCLAGDRETALALIEQAIQAEGGPQLAKAATMVRTAKGVMAPVGVDVPFNVETALHAPDQLRATFAIGVVGDKLHVVLILNGDRGWRSSGGAPVDLSKGERDELRETAYVAGLTTLVPLRDKAFELAPLPESKVGDRPALGVKVAHKDRVTVQLYFDKQTHRLVKIERQTKEAGLAVTKEALLIEYKEFDGLQMPTRIVELTNAKKTAELTVTGYKFPGKLDEGTFAKP
jgi:hypothetical protein